MGLFNNLWREVDTARRPGTSRRGLDHVYRTLNNTIIKLLCVPSAPGRYIYDPVCDYGTSVTVLRREQGTPATHPLTGRELRALRRLQREQRSKSPFIFVSERSAPFAKRGFQAMVERTARAAGFDMKIHSHMLPLQMPRP